MMFLRMFILIFFCKRETSEDFPCSHIETVCCHGDLTLTEDEVLDGNHKHITPPRVWAPTELNNNQKRFPALLPDFNREELGTSLEITGLATIDPHNKKEHTEIHKIPKFRVNLVSFD